MANIKPKEIIKVLSDMGFTFVSNVGDHSKYTSGETKLTAEVPVAHSQSSEGVIKNCLEVAFLEAKIRNIDILSFDYSKDILEKLQDIEKKMEDDFFVMPYQSIGRKMIPGIDKIKDFIKEKQEEIRQNSLKNKQTPNINIKHKKSHQNNRNYEK